MKDPPSRNSRSRARAIGDSIFYDSQGKRLNPHREEDKREIERIINSVFQLPQKENGK